MNVATRRRCAQDARPRFPGPIGAGEGPEDKAPQGGMSKDALAKSPPALQGLDQARERRRSTGASNLSHNPV